MPRRFAPVLIGMVILVGTVVFGVLLEQVILAQSAFKMARVRRELTAAETRHQELLLAATELETPARVQRFARSELGMTEPQSVDYIVSEVVVRPRSVLRSLSSPRSVPPAGRTEASAYGLGEGTDP